MRQYCRLRKPSLKTTNGRLTFSGPSPGAPAPPRMQVVTHFRVQFSASADRGRSIRPERPLLSPDNSCGTFSNVASSAGAYCWLKDTSTNMVSTWRLHEVRMLDHDHPLVYTFLALLLALVSCFRSIKSARLGFGCRCSMQVSGTFRLPTPGMVDIQPVAALGRTICLYHRKLNKLREFRASILNNVMLKRMQIARIYQHDFHVRL